LNTSILIAHEPVGDFNYDDAISKHFRRFGIEANPYFGNTSRLLWSRPLDVKTVYQAIRKSPLKCVWIAEQSEWCDLDFADKLKSILSPQGSREP